MTFIRHLIDTILLCGMLQRAPATLGDRQPTSLRCIYIRSHPVLSSPATQIWLKDKIFTLSRFKSIKKNTTD